MKSRICSILILVGLLAPSASAQESWVGKIVVAKKVGIKMRPVDDADREVELTKRSEFAFWVLDEKRDLLKVKTRDGTVGWFAKDDAVLLTDAPAYFTERIRANGKDAEAYYGRAVARQLKGAFDLALADFEEALRLKPTPAMYHNRSSIWFRRNEDDKGIADCSAALKLDPKHTGALFDRGVGWLNKREYDKAFADFDDVIRLDPKNAQAYRGRGVVWQYKNKLEAAIKDYSEAIRLNPKDAFAYSSRGNAWFDKRESEKAIADYGKAIRLNPNDAFAYWNRGIAWRSEKEYDKAIADFTEAIRLNPNHASSYNNRGISWRNKKEYGKALADMTEAIRRNPKYAPAHNSLAWLRATCPDPKWRDGKQAVQSAQQAVALDPNNGGYMDSLAAAHAEAGDFDEAVRWQKRAMQDPLYRDNPELQRRLELYQMKQPYRAK